MVYIILKTSVKLCTAPIEHFIPTLYTVACDHINSYSSSRALETGFLVVNV